MEPKDAIFEWLKPASAGEEIWNTTEIDRDQTNQDYDDKIFNPDLYDSIKVDDQFYLNNSGAYLIIDNTVKKPSGTRDLMRLELHDYPESSDTFWAIQPYTSDDIEIFEMNHTQWTNAFARDVERSSSNWDIHYLMEYLGNPRFRPLNWTQFPDTLLP